jgi:DNA-binding NtrC family response regulator
MDLYYRLNIFAIHIPPLRDRKEDIPLLFDHFTSQAAQLHHKDPVRIQRQAMNMLIEYPFPGNVRELKNIAERIVILNDEPRITVKTLESVLFPGNRLDHRPVAANHGIARQEADLIVDALRQSENVIARAARLLHITDQSLLRRIKKFGITIPG